jgi:hypothetical protein
MIETTEIDSALSTLGRLKQENATLRESAAPKRPANPDQREVMADNERMLAALPALTAKAAARNINVAKLVLSGVDILADNGKLTTRFNYLTESLAVASPPESAQLPQAPRQPATGNSPKAHSSTPPQRTGAPKNWTAPCQEHVAANGRTPIRLGAPDEAQARRDLSVQNYKQDNTETTYERPDPFSQAKPQPAPSAVARTGTWHEKVLAHLAANRRPSPTPKLSASQVSKMSWTELCNAARDNLSAEEVERENVRFTAYNEGVRTS